LDARRSTSTPERRYLRRVPATSTRPLSPALSPFVTGLHHLESESESAPTLERILPGGQVHLMVNLHEDEFRIYDGVDCSTVWRSRGAVLEGPSSKARVIDTGLQRNLICVDFTLGGAAAFFRPPISDARDGLVELDQLWGRDGSVLRERLLEAPTPAEKLRVLDAVLVEHFVHRDAPDPAIDRAASLLERGASIAAVASHVGVLSKTLTRRFHASVGLTPKRYSRVRRLQRVLGAIRDPRDVDWCETAVTHGYADQAHLVHDFRELTGITPTAYRPRSVEERNHVPVGLG
jgi:AraC-like DNA-binding protein